MVKYIGCLTIYKFLERRKMQGENRFASPPVIIIYLDCYNINKQSLHSPRVFLFIEKTNKYHCAQTRAKLRGYINLMMNYSFRSFLPAVPKDSGRVILLVYCRSFVFLHNYISWNIQENMNASVWSWSKINLHQVSRLNM